MNKREENKYSMYKGVEKVLDENASVITPMTAFNDSVKSFKSILQQISDKDNQYRTVSKGATATKDNAEDDLIEIILKVASSAYVYGRKTKNESLKALCKVTPSELRQMRDTVLLQKGKDLYSKVNPVIGSLNTYGITAAIMTDLQNKTNTFESTLGSKESKFADSKASRQDLGKLFDDADDILKEEIDTFMDVIKEANVSFYNKYQAARVIKDV